MKLTYFNIRGLCEEEYVHMSGTEVNASEVDAMAEVEFNKFCDNIGKLISFNFNNKKRKGIFEGINEDGRARLLIDEKIKLFDSIVLD